MYYYLLRLLLQLLRPSVVVVALGVVSSWRLETSRVRSKRPKFSVHDEKMASDNNQAASRVVVHHRSPLLLPANDNSSVVAAAAETPKTALILLNAPLGNDGNNSPSPLLERLWEIADVRICADGGANRLYALQRQDWVPDMIRGDLDSLKPAVRDYYQLQGVSMECNPDQDSNDLDKSLTAAIRQEGCRRCLVYGAFGGRFDQEMGCFQALYKWASTPDEPSIWLYDDHTTACLLYQDCENHIQLALPAAADDDNEINSSVVGEGPTCGLIPLGAPCEFVTTTGFQWNLSHQPTAFGGLVSTSNRIVYAAAQPVTVVTSAPLIFTAQVHCGRVNAWSS